MTAATASMPSNLSDPSSSMLAKICDPYLPFDAGSSVWSDVKPHFQDEGPSPMCPILYQPTYSSAMDIYRALVSSNRESTETTPSVEISPRALALTQHLILLNPSHYSVWQYRAQILLRSQDFLPSSSSELSQPQSSSTSSSSSGCDASHHQTLMDQRQQLLLSELEFLDDLAHKNMKSYQVWQHRRIIVSELGLDPTKELEFVKQNLAKDAKNYHTWCYRQWILAHFGGLSLGKGSESTMPSTEEESASGGENAKGAAQFPHLWDGELEYTEQLLRQDIRNNSAWNHRWFVLFGRFGLTGAQHDHANSTIESGGSLNQEGSRTHDWDAKLSETIRFELAFTKQSLALVPNNSSAWNYFRALHTKFPIPTRMETSLSFVQTLISSNAEVEKDPSLDMLGRSPPQALEWWLDTIQQQLDALFSTPSLSQAQAQAQVQTQASTTTDTANSESRADVEAETKKLLDTAETLTKRLCIADSVRKRFWAYRLKSIRRVGQQKAQQQQQQQQW